MLFKMLTGHGAAGNRTPDVMRLSIDLRDCGESHAIAGNWLRPHFDNLGERLLGTFWRTSGTTARSHVIGIGVATCRRRAMIGSESMTGVPRSGVASVRFGGSGGHRDWRPGPEAPAPGMFLGLGSSLRTLSQMARGSLSRRSSTIGTRSPQATADPAGCMQQQHGTESCWK